MITPEEIARVCHEANRAFCRSLRDDSQDPWDLAALWQQDSAIAGVKFRLANPNAPASAQHESWLEQKRVDGWKFGKVKDAVAKEHPCFVPYAELPDEQKAKDALFCGVVDALKPLLVS